METDTTSACWKMDAHCDDFYTVVRSADSTFVRLQKTGSGTTAFLKLTIYPKASVEESASDQSTVSEPLVKQREEGFQQKGLPHFGNAGATLA
jgi:hypothetical protein